MTTTAKTAEGRLDALRAIAGELIARDGWSRQRLVVHQREGLRALLTHAIDRSPYYREALGADAPERPLEELPTLSKETLMEQWDRIACAPGLRLADAEAHAAGPDAGRPLDGRYRVGSTSGASGLRGLFVYGPQSWATWVAACLRGFARVGLGPGARVVGIAGADGAHISKQVYDTLAATSGGSPELSALTPLDDMVETLNVHQPEALMGYPSVAARLADEQLAGRLRIQPRIAVFSSEPLTEDVRARVRAAWGIECGNAYASTEAILIALSTPEYPHAAELTEDLLVIEVVAADNRPVPAGASGDKLLITDLTNLALPLIRYELSDRVTVSVGPNPSGRPYRHLAAIEGRSADTLELPAANGGHVHVPPYRLGEPFGRLPDVRGFQVVWDGRALSVQIVPRRDAPAGTPERVRSALARALAEAGTASVPIAVEPVHELEREPGPAAKLKLIKATVPGSPGQAAEAPHPRPPGQ